VLIGWTSGISYNVYAWVKDAAGNISTNTATGTTLSGTDMFTITYSPSVAPEIWDVIAANSDTTANPPTRSETTVPAGSDVYIRWKAKDPDKALPASAISLFYSEDEINFTGISTAQGLGANSNNCPNITLATDEGCYKWTGGSPLNNAYKIRATVTDSDGLKTQSISNPLNNGNLRIIAGNTESGLGGSATEAMFFTKDAGSEADPGTLVVTDQGQIYIADSKRGILTIDPVDGKQKIFIPQTGTSSGDGGTATNATLNNVLKMTLDYNNRLLILDVNRIRRVDLNQSPPSIETIIGGGTETTDVVDNPLNLKITGHSTNSWHTRNTVLFAMPNGDIWFESDSSGHVYPSENMRIRIFNNATGKIESKFVTGTGDGWDATVDITQCAMFGLSVEFDLTSSEVQWGTTHTYHHDNYTGCVSNYANDTYRYARAWLDNTLTAVSPKNNGHAYAHYFHRQGMDGKIYSFVYDRYLVRVDQDGTFTRVVGTGTKGTCVDGTPVTSCNMEVQDVFVTASGQYYFNDGGAIRTVDGNGNVVTIAGQKKAYGDGINALNARFNEPQALGRRADGKIIVGDSYYLKEFTIEGNINIIAGNGNYDGLTDTGVDPKTRGLYASDWFVVDPASGDVYIRGHYNRPYRLNRSTGFFEKVAGGGATSYKDGDGLAGSSIKDRHHLPLGFANGKLLVGRMFWNSTEAHWEDFMWKYYDTTDTVTPYKQSHLAGTADPTTTYTGGYAGICASGSVAANCKVPYYSYTGLMSWDPNNNRWVFVRRMNNSTHGDEIWTVSDGGNITQLVTLPRFMTNSYLYTRINTVDYLFYCRYGRIYKHNMTTNTDMGALPWTMSTMSCSGQSIAYDPTINALIFPFTQNGMGGVAAYYDPDNP
ncbi:MAG: hypothetical protein KC478_09165, partial [Bacteriovoracaceae bacterium]|nr:hypothetical protein [Bacteriovoracaceae bacterium]